MKSILKLRNHLNHKSIGVRFDQYPITVTGSTSLTIVQVPNHIQAGNPSLFLHRTTIDQNWK